MGGDWLNRVQDRRHRRDAAEVGPQAERNQGQRPGLTSDYRERMKAMERDSGFKQRHPSL
jgi:hypothetical protein